MRLALMGILALGVLVSITTRADESSVTNGSGTTQKKETQTIWVGNRKGESLENARVSVGYWSSHYSPVTFTDANGKADVSANFNALVISVPDISLTVQAPVEGPCKFTLPTGKKRVDRESTDSVAAPVLSDNPKKQFVLIRNREGQGIMGARITVGHWTIKNRPVFRTNAAGEAEIMLDPKSDEFTIAVDGIQLAIRASEVDWPCEIKLPTGKTEVR